MAQLLAAIELLGTLAFAYGGVIAARRRNMDVVGAYAAALASAFGGGTLRDILLQRGPLYWVANPGYPLMILALTLAMFAFMRGRPLADGGLVLLILDALGLGLFSAVGVSIALSAAVPAFPAALFGVITATFGGVLRDIIGAEIPHVFRQSQLYATCAFLGAWVYIVAGVIFGEGPAAVVACVVVAAGLRLAAVRFDLRLPV